MWSYQGVEDTHRPRKDELSNNELEAFLRNIIKPSCLELDPTVQPFSAAYPPNPVSFLLGLCCIPFLFR